MYLRINNIKLINYYFNIIHKNNDNPKYYYNISLFTSTINKYFYHSIRMISVLEIYRKKVIYNTSHAKVTNNNFFQCINTYNQLIHSLNSLIYYLTNSKYEYYSKYVSLIQ